MDPNAQGLYSQAEPLAQRVLVIFETALGRILPLYLRRSKQVSEVLPLLYLRGLSTGDFQEALPVLLGEEAAGLSPSSITRLVSVWEEYRTWRTRSLADKDYVYVWADGVHFNIRLEEDRLAALVLIGVRQDGTKVRDGDPSTQTQLSRLRDWES